MEKKWPSASPVPTADGASLFLNDDQQEKPAFLRVGPASPFSIVVLNIAAITSRNTPTVAPTILDGKPLAFWTAKVRPSRKVPLQLLRSTTLATLSPLP